MGTAIHLNPESAHNVSNSFSECTPSLQSIQLDLCFQVRNLQKIKRSPDRSEPPRVPLSKCTDEIDATPDGTANRCLSDTFENYFGEDLWHLSCFTNVMKCTTKQIILLQVL
jgi:hypothetical protein